MELKNLSCLVTGGASGLGAATVRLLASRGAKVGIFDTNESAAQAVANEINGHAECVDVTSDESVEQGLGKVTEALGAVPRVVVNCAGIGQAARIVGRDGKLSIDLFEQTIAVNLVGSYRVMSFAARLMGQTELLEASNNERGLIINTSSVAWQDGQFGQAAYASSKGGIASLCLPAARELANSGIRVMTIAPGLFETAMTETLSDTIKSSIVKNIPFPPRLGQAQEYALLVEHIITNPFINGTTYRLDGGMRLPSR